MKLKTLAAAVLALGLTGAAGAASAQTGGFRNMHRTEQRTVIQQHGNSRNSVQVKKIDRQQLVQQRAIQRQRELKRMRMEQLSHRRQVQQQGGGIAQVLGAILGSGLNGIL